MSFTHEPRILIADPSQDKCWQMEKILNRLGFHCILPVTRLSDCYKLTNKILPAFDLLLISNLLISDKKLTELWLSNTSIKNVLLYENGCASLSYFSEGERLFVSSPTTADNEAIVSMMSIISASENSVVAGP